jgi:alanine dehydrogenase
VHDVIHYGVANMPGAVPRTSTQALTNTTFPFVERIAGEGLEAALVEPTLRQGVNLWRGAVTCEGVALSLELPYTPLDDVLGQP